MSTASRRGLRIGGAIAGLLFALALLWTQRPAAPNYEPAVSTVPAPGAFKFTLLHTNDLHSHLLGSGPDAAYRDATDSPVRGHSAHLLGAIKTLREQRRQRDEPVLLVDAGDFFGGSVFQALGPLPGADAPELEFFLTAGYDAVTLGNHEYDAGEDALLEMLGKKQIPLVTTNLHAPAVNDVGARRKIVKLKSGGRELKVLLLGIQGPDALRNSLPGRKTHGYVGLNDANGSARLPELIALLQKEIDRHPADVRILIGHSGAPEDIKIAAGLRNLDVFVAGHTHQLYEKVRRVGTTYLVQTGCYGRNLGVLDLHWHEGRLGVANAEKPYEEITTKWPADKAWLKRIETFKKRLNPILAPSGFKNDEVVFVLSKDQRRQRRLNDPYGVRTLTLVKKSFDRKLEKPLDVYFTTMSLVRDDLRTDGGKPTPQLFSDVFRVFAIGFDAQLRPGSPVVEFYLRKADFLRVTAFLEFYRRITGNFTPLFSDDFAYESNRWGLPLVNQVDQPLLRGEPFEKWPDLVHVGTSVYAANFLPKLKGISRGWIDLAPLDAEGKPKALTPFDGVSEASLLAESLRREGF